MVRVIFSLMVLMGCSIFLASSRASDLQDFADSAIHVRVKDKGGQNVKLDSTPTPNPFTRVRDLRDATRIYPDMAPCYIHFFYEVKYGAASQALADGYLTRKEAIKLGILKEFESFDTDGNGRATNAEIVAYVDARNSRGLGLGLTPICLDTSK